jgi:uncharacterized membrane protein
MGLGHVHVVAAVVALCLAAAVLLAAKGTTRHVRLGRAYVLVMLVGVVAALTVYDETGRPGPFHLFGVVSLVTLAGGLLTSPRRRRGDRTAHGSFMLWSVVGLVTAGLAQAANALLPDAAPWPVVVVTATVVAAGALLVPPALRAGAARA